ncbi:hypothetical protein [Azospirillum sp. B506]|uniref:hypothetical protein n=1 Tax=Azospirillum sp. B506 TaxID=137721 RepID=UPI0003478949|nr:hypothetical protein [Azospirillum sp. B506]
MENGHSAQAASIEYHDFLRNFREKIDAVSKRIDSKSQMPLWEKFSIDLHELSKSRDMRQFLHFSPITASMVVGETDYILKEYNYLKNIPEWESRWVPALRENIFGMPIPSSYYPSSSNNLIHHAYHVAKFESATGKRFDEMDIIFEFGGGYGSFCRLARNLGFRGRYIIFDLPAFSALQQFFLQSIGLKATDNLNELKDDTTLCCSDLPTLKPFLSEQIARNAERSAFVATWSFSESPLTVREEFEPLLPGFNHFLIAYQKNFFGFDNAAYFNRIESMIGNASWKTEETVNSDNFYKFGSVSKA